MQPAGTHQRAAGVKKTSRAAGGPLLALDQRAAGWDSIRGRSSRATTRNPEASSPSRIASPTEKSKSPMLLSSSPEAKRSENRRTRQFRGTLNTTTETGPRLMDAILMHCLRPRNAALSRSYYSYYSLCPEATALARVQRKPTQISPTMRLCGGAQKHGVRGQPRPRPVQSGQRLQLRAFSWPIRPARNPGSTRLSGQRVHKSSQMWLALRLRPSPKENK